MIRLLILLLFGLIGISAQTQNTLNSLNESSLSKFDDPLKTFYSSGFSDRAEKLSATLKKASDFYKEHYSAEPELYLAFLDQNDWRELRGRYPYGLPNVSSSGNMSIIFLPAENSLGVVADVYKNIQFSIPDSVITKVNNYNLSYRQMIDIIGFHEVGHSAARSIRLPFSVRWFDEFVATYLAYDFLTNEEPELAETFIKMAECGLAGIDPSFGKLSVE